MRPTWHSIRVSIRTQLMVLVLVVAFFSLLVLAIVNGVYFTTIFTESRATRLQVIAQLKAAQMHQSISSYYYQLNLLSTRDSIENALSYSRAGTNYSSSISSARDTMQQTLDSSDTLSSARLYDVDLNVITSTTNSEDTSNITSQDIDTLYILGHVGKSDIPDGLIDNGNYLSDAIVGNDSQSFFISMTAPIYTNTSLLVATPTLAGYLTLIINLSSLQSIANTTSSNDYTGVSILQPVTPYNNYTNITQFQAIYDTDNLYSLSNGKINISSYAPALQTWEYHQKEGQYTSIKSLDNAKVAMGYSEVDLSWANWLITVQQSRSEFLSPTVRLTKIMIGVCFGIALVMVILTFPLAHYGVRPIINLQRATEEITRRRGLGSHHYKRRKSKNNRFYSRKSTELNEKTVSTTTGPEGVQPDTGSSNDRNNSASSPIYSSSSESDRPRSRQSFNSYPRRNTNGSLGTNMSGVITSMSNDSYSADFSPYSGGDENQNTLAKRKGLFYDELTELTDAFEAMSEELEKSYTHLEDRVKARTKELEVAKIQADKARQEAEDANEAKTVFIANISHELRTPLNGILGMTSVAMAENDPSKIQSSLELIFRSGELLLHILTQLLTFSKNQLDKTKLQEKNFLMLEVASQIKSIFGKTAKDHNVHLRVVMKPFFLNKIIFFADSNRIIQVIMNLVSNSLKFTPEEGSVGVTVRVIGEYDEERSKAVNYEKVYIKGKRDDANASSVHSREAGSGTGSASTSATASNGAPLLPVKTGTNTSITQNKIEEVCPKSLSPTSSETAHDSDELACDRESIHTLRSSIYERCLAESYNFGNHDTSASVVKKIDCLNEDDEDFGNFTNSNSNKLEYTDFQGQNKTWVIQFTVTDTGPGIAEALQEKIFEAFIQGDQTLSRSYGGTGLGLSICKQFSKIMRGTLALKSKVGHGSTFIFTIPMPQIGELILDSIPEQQNFRIDEFTEENYRKETKKVSFAHDVPPGASVDHLHTETALEPLSEAEGGLVSSGDENDAPVLHHNNTSTGNLRLRVSKNGAVRSPSHHPADDDISSYFDKPDLITRASTGTAHSSRTARKSSSESFCNRSDSLPRSIDSVQHQQHERVASISSNNTTSSVPDSSPPSKRQMKFLVAEDNLVNQEVVKRMLKLEGFTDVTLACDGDEAINILRDSIEKKTEPFDLIFMDVQMPNMDGLTATRIIRSEFKYDKPIVALTAFADKSNQNDCVEAGMSGFLSKPVRRNLLKKIIHEFCGGAAAASGNGNEHSRNRSGSGVLDIGSGDDSDGSSSAQGNRAISGFGDLKSRAKNVSGTSQPTTIDEEE